jgi:N-methylhydantoinase A/oxoprolinase/acetone carboxylase beta subunit
VSATMPGGSVSLGEADAERNGEIEQARRTATLAGEQIELEVLRGTPAPGTAIDGPAVVELPEATLLIPPDWTGEVDATGTVHVKSAKAAKSADADSVGESPGGDSPGGDDGSR